MQYIKLPCTCLSPTLQNQMLGYMHMHNLFIVMHLHTMPEYTAAYKNYYYVKFMPERTGNLGYAHATIRIISYNHKMKNLNRNKLAHSCQNHDQSS